MTIRLWGTRAPGNAQDSRDITLLKNKKKVMDGAGVDYASFLRSLLIAGNKNAYHCCGRFWCMLVSFAIIQYSVCYNNRNKRISLHQYYLVLL